MIRYKIALRSTFILFGIFTSFILSSKAGAIAYYVDAVNGNDSNAGSSAALAWKTIQHAANIAQAGDIVYVKEGTYNERVNFAHAGNSGNRIVFQSSPRRTAAVNGGFNINKDYIRVEGFKITSSVNRQNGVDVNGDYAEVVDNYIWNVRGRAIIGNQSAKPRGAYIADNHVYHCQMGIMVYGTDWLISGNEVERMYMYGASDDCDYARIFGDGNTFVGNFFHGNQVNEIGSAHVDCFQTWCEGPNSDYWATNSVIDGNICFDFHQAFMIEAGNCGDKVSHYTITNNIFAHTFNTSLGGYGINNEGVDHVTVINNTFADLNYGGADMYAGNDSAEYAVVKNNIFYNCGRGYSFSSPSTSTGDYNLIYGAIDPSPPAPHNIIGVDPQFVDADNDNFNLQPESPACGAGEGGSDMGAIPCGGSTPDTEAPSPPTNLQAQTVSSSQINLSWDPSNDNVGVTGYKIYRNGTQIGNASLTAYQDPGLSPSTTYSYSISAYDGAGNESEKSDPVSITTQASVPAEAIIEAEAGALIPPMQIVPDSEASGGSYILTTDSSGAATFTFFIETPGIYKIIARVYAKDSDQDSFYFNIDDQPEDIWDLNPTGTPSEFNIWREDEVTKRGSGTYDSPQYDPYTIELTQGSHTITFRAREPNCRLDYFYFSEVNTPPNPPTGFKLVAH